MCQNSKKNPRPKAVPSTRTCTTGHHPGPPRVPLPITPGTTTTRYPPTACPGHSRTACLSSQGEFARLLLNSNKDIGQSAGLCRLANIPNFSSL